MKPKMIDYPESIFDRQPQEIKQLLIDVARGNVPESQKDIVGDMLAESKLMIEAAEYIRLLESLLDIHVQFAGDREYGHEWMGAWKELAKNQKELSSEFVKIVEENFWELLA